MNQLYKLRKIDLYNELCISPNFSAMNMFKLIVIIYITLVFEVFKEYILLLWLRSCMVIRFTQPPDWLCRVSREAVTFGENLSHRWWFLPFLPSINSNPITTIRLYMFPLNIYPLECSNHIMSCHSNIRSVWSVMPWSKFIIFEWTGCTT